MPDERSLKPPRKRRSRVSKSQSGFQLGTASGSALTSNLSTPWPVFPPLPSGIEPVLKYLPHPESFDAFETHNAEQRTAVASNSTHLPLIHPNHPDPRSNNQDGTPSPSRHNGPVDSIETDKLLGVLLERIKVSTSAEWEAEKMMMIGEWEAERQRVREERARANEDRGLLEDCIENLRLENDAEIEVRLTERDKFERWLDVGEQGRETERRRWEEEKEALQAEARELNSEKVKLSTAEADLTTARLEIAALTSNNVELCKEADSLSQGILQHAKRSREAEDRIVSLEREKDAMETRLAVILDEREAEMKRLKKETDGMKTRLKEECRRVEVAIAVLEQMEGLKEQILQSQQSHDDEIERLRQEFDLDLKKAENLVTGRHLDEMDKLRSTYDHRIEEAEQTLMKENMALSEQRTALETKIQTLEQMNWKWADEKTQLQSKVIEAEQDLHNEKRRRHQDSILISQLEVEIKELKSEVVRSQWKINTETDKLSIAEVDLASVRQEVKTLTSTNVKLSEKVCELEGKLQSCLDLAKATEEDLRSQLDAAEERIHTKDEVIAGLQEDAVSIQRARDEEITKFRDDLEQAATTTLSLRAHVENLESEKTRLSFAHTKFTAKVEADRQSATRKHLDELLPLRVQVTQLKDQLGVMKGELECQNDNLVRTQKELETALLASSRLSLANEELVSKIDGLEKAGQLCEERLKVVEGEIAAGLLEKETLQEELGQRLEALEAQNKRAGELEQEMETTRLTLSGVSQELITATEKLNCQIQQVEQCQTHIAGLESDLNLSRAGHRDMTGAYENLKLMLAEEKAAKTARTKHFNEEMQRAVVAEREKCDADKDYALSVLRSDLETLYQGNIERMRQRVKDAVDIAG